MRKRATSRSGFFSRRALITVLLCAAACSVLTGSLPAVLRSEKSARFSKRALTFAERVVYQRAIEDVYWRHRIWPKENPYPKPSFDEVMSQAQLEKKVEDYLRSTQALQDYWQRPITAEDLQAEMDRMAKNTKQPEVLRELFEALGNDPFVIAECLARPVLAEQLPTNSWASEQRVHGVANEPLDLWLAKIETEISNTMPTTIADYRLPAISAVEGGCVDTWTPTDSNNAPEARDDHTAVWTGSEMIVWGGANPFILNTGGRYTPSTDSWVATSTTNAPAARVLHTAVWTGNEMIVWGGNDNDGPPPQYFNTGGTYNPSTNSWMATTIANVPSARASHSAVWSGSEMIIWGGTDQNFVLLNTGGRYDPGTNSWIATNTTNTPEARNRHTAVWTSNEMILWGGFDGSGALNTGGRYDPGANSWTATTTNNAPPPRFYHTAIWTGSEMVVWGGSDFPNPTYFNTGGRYCAQSGPSPTPTPTPTSTATATATASPTPTPTPTPCMGRCAPTPRPRPTPAPRP